MHIAHDADTDEIVLGGVVDDEPVVGVAARCNCRVHVARNDPMPSEEMLNDTVVVGC